MHECSAPSRDPLSILKQLLYGTTKRAVSCLVDLSYNDIPSLLEPIYLETFLTCSGGRVRLPAVREWRIHLHKDFMVNCTAYIRLPLFTNRNMGTFN